jgi:hypothetical protein
MHGGGALTTPSQYSFPFHAPPTPPTPPTPPSPPPTPELRNCSAWILELEPALEASCGGRAGRQAAAAWPAGSGHLADYHRWRRQTCARPPPPPFLAASPPPPAHLQRGLNAGGQLRGVCPHRIGRHCHQLQQHAEHAHLAVLKVWG